MDAQPKIITAFPAVCRPLEVYPLQQPYPVTRAVPPMPLSVAFNNSPKSTVSSKFWANPSGDRLDFEVFLRLRVRDITRPFPASDVLSFRGLCSPPRFSSSHLHSARTSMFALRSSLRKAPRFRTKPNCLRFRTDVCQNIGGIRRTKSLPPSRVVTSYPFLSGLWLQFGLSSGIHMSGFGCWP